MKQLLCVALLFLGNLTTANATLINVVDHGTYLTDTVSGLDWYDVSATAGQSYNAVSAQLGLGGALEGWRYASAAEFGRLLEDTGVTNA